MLLRYLVKGLKLWIYLNICFYFSYFFALSNAKDLEPTFSLNTSGSVTDIVFNDNKLFVSTTASSLDIFDIKQKKKLKLLKFLKLLILLEIS